MSYPILNVPQILDSIKRLYDVDISEESLRGGNGDGPAFLYSLILCELTGKHEGNFRTDTLPRLRNPELYAGSHIRLLRELIRMLRALRVSTILTSEALLNLEGDDGSFRTAMSALISFLMFTRSASRDLDAVETRVQRTVALRQQCDLIRTQLQNQGHLLAEKVSVEQTRHQVEAEVAREIALHETVQAECAMVRETCEGEKREQAALGARLEAQRENLREAQDLQKASPEAVAARLASLRDQYFTYTQLHADAAQRNDQMRRRVDQLESSQATLARAETLLDEIVQMQEKKRTEEARAEALSMKVTVQQSNLQLSKAKLETLGEKMAAIDRQLSQEAFRLKEIHVEEAHMKEEHSKTFLQLQEELDTLNQQIHALVAERSHVTTLSTEVNKGLSDEIAALRLKSSKIRYELSKTNNLIVGISAKVDATNQILEDAIKKCG